MVTIPTLTQLYSRVLADLQTAYGSTIPAFGKNFLRAAAAYQAGKLKLMYLAIGILQKNMAPDTADSEANGGTLERYGRIKIGRNPFPATAGQYQIQVTGAIGAQIKASQTFKSNDDALNPGALFILDNTYTLVSTTDSIIVRALTAGLDSKLQIGDGLTSTSPIANVNADAVVLTETVQPLAAEDIESYRNQVISAYRLEPEGGAASDYRLWAQDAQGVQNSYAFAKTGATSEINLYVEATIADSIDGKGTPSNFLLNEVKSVVEFDPDTTKALSERGRRPLTAIVNYLPISPKNVDIQIQGFVGLTLDTQNAIRAAMQIFLDNVRPFVAGADVLADKNDIFGINQIIAIILTVKPGSIFGTITLTVDGSPTTSYTFINGNIPFLNTITYV